MDFATLASQLNAGAILPEGIVIATLLIVMVSDLIAGRKRSARFTPYLGIAGLLAAVVALYTTQWTIADPIAFFGAFNSDPLSVAFRSIIALSSVVTILMSVRYVEQSGTPVSEFVTILLSATLGGMFLSGADELVMIFVSLETLSISSYLLTGYTKRDPRSNDRSVRRCIESHFLSAFY